MTGVRHWSRSRKYFASLLLVGLMGLISLAIGKLGGSDHSAVAAVATEKFPQPRLRRSHDGVLQTTLDARIAENALEDELTGETRVIHTPTFEGTIPGPTLVVNPGDTLSLNLVNDLPPNPPGQRAGAFPHNFYTVNLHTHGLQVSPLGISDNPFREMEPGTSNPIKVEIPADHPSGTYWYHPHVHGTVTYQLLSGMAGFLIIKGGPGTLDDVPEVKAAKDMVMGFQVIRTDLNGEVPFVNEQATVFGTFPPSATDPTLQGVWSTFGVDAAPGKSFYYFTTNGVTNPTLHMRPGEVQRWRLLDAAQGENLLLSLQGHDLNAVAMDGLPRRTWSPSPRARRSSWVLASAMMF